MSIGVSCHSGASDVCVTKSCSWVPTRPLLLCVLAPRLACPFHNNRLRWSVIWKSTLVQSKLYASPQPWDRVVISLGDVTEEVTFVPRIEGRPGQRSIRTCTCRTEWLWVWRSSLYCTFMCNHVWSQAEEWMELANGGISKCTWRLYCVHTECPHAWILPCLLTHLALVTNSSARRWVGTRNGKKELW